MCGRYTLTRPGDVLTEVLEELQASVLATPLTAPLGVDTDGLAPRYNAAPSQSMPLVAVDQPLAGTVHGTIELATWGVVTRGGRLVINLRGEGAPAKAGAWQRCLVPADGFFEWHKVGGRSQPYWFHRGDGRAMCFAGLFRREPAKAQPSFAIVTRPALEPVARYHSRMPLILAARRWRTWLLREGEANEQAALLEESDFSDGLLHHPVNPKVGNARFDGPDLIDPAPQAPLPLRLF